VKGWVCFLLLSLPDLCLLCSVLFAFGNQTGIHADCSSEKQVLTALNENTDDMDNCRKKNTTTSTLGPLSASGPGGGAASAWDSEEEEEEEEEELYLRLEARDSRKSQIHPRRYDMVP